MTPRFGTSVLAAAAAILMACAPASAQLYTEPSYSDPFPTNPTRVQPIPLAVAWSPDGRFVANGYVKPARAIGRVGVLILDAASGELVHVLWHDEGVRSVAWSPDGRFIASGSYDETVRIWDAANGKTVRTLTGHSSQVESVAWSPDGRFIASGSYDKTVRIWDAASGRPARTLTGHTASVVSVAWSPDGRFIASGGFDGTVLIWDAASGKTVRALTVLRTHEFSRAASVAWSPDGRFIASTAGNSVRVWDAANGKPVRILIEHSGTVTSVAWSPDGRFFASGSADRTVRIWDAASGKTVRIVTEDDVVNSVAWSPDGSSLASNRRVHPNVLPPSSTDHAPRQGVPEQYAALAQSGHARFEKRDYEGAEADFTKALAGSPPESARAELHYARAYARYLQGRPDRAAEDLDAALRLKPDARAYGLRGRIRLEKGSYAAARDDLGQTLKLGPPGGAAGSAEAHFLRARAAIGLGNRDAAIGDLSAAIGQAPRVDFYFERANLYRAAGAADKALADYSAVLQDEKAPAVMRTRTHLGRALVHHARRDADNAMADYDAFFAGLPEADEQTRAFGASIIQRLAQAGLYSGNGKQYDATLRIALAECVAAPACVF